ncbi:MAG: CDP-glycerol glycerophosphotransferase family protein [Spirochaetaceae bacterium]|jgi:hypothetical protein|nr:CDP-glycerol glycerophosphotransferase family protein [Spirochaetaceae bacterium]
MFSSLYPLYIDPGTGSMLFSLFVSLVAAGYFLFRALIIKVKFAFPGKRAAEPGFFFVIYNEARQYWCVFKPILDEFERRKIPVRYLTSVKEDPFFDCAYSHISGEYIGAGNRAFARLNFLEADVCLMTTPGLEVYQLKRSKFVRHYSHILHDTGDATCYRLFGIDWFDSILLSGEYQIAGIRDLERIRSTRRKELPVIGSTYLDMYREVLSSLPGEDDHPFTVLVSPTWGPGSLLNVWGPALLDPLLETGWRIILRPHPQSKTSEAALLARLEERYKNSPGLEWDHNAENITTLAKSDVMVSDFSGVIFDFAFLFNRPIFYSHSSFNPEMYDAGDLDRPLWKFDAVKAFGLEIGDPAALPRRIHQALSGGGLGEEREKAKNTAWQNPGGAAAGAVDFLVKVKETLG